MVYGGWWITEDAGQGSRFYIHRSSTRRKTLNVFRRNFFPFEARCFNVHAQHTLFPFLTTTLPLQQKPHRATNAHHHSTIPPDLLQRIPPYLRTYETYRRAFHFTGSGHCAKPDCRIFGSGRVGSVSNRRVEGCQVLLVGGHGAVAGPCMREATAAKTGVGGNIRES